MERYYDTNIVTLSAFISLILFNQKKNQPTEKEENMKKERERETYNSVDNKWRDQEMIYMKNPVQC